MLNLVKTVILMFTLLISACDIKSEMGKIENPIAGHVKALEQPKDLEKQLLEAEQKTREAIEKATK